MFILYSFISAIILLLLSYPYLKFYQLCGYKIKIFLKNILDSINFKADKNRLVFTKRIIRFLLIYFIFLLILSGLIFYFVKNFYLYIIDFAVILILLPFLLIFAHMFILPLEETIKKAYINKAKKVLKNFKGKKIAIVGSYGKTSVKSILAHILSYKFKVLSTIKNYNTPMGICKSVLKNRLNSQDFAIFEMGARHEGDIKELTKMVDPDYVIITPLGPQHIETFKSIEGVKRAKSEVLKYLKEGGIALFDGFNDLSKELYLKHTKTKYLTGKDGKFCDIKNINHSCSGLKFDLFIDGKSAKVQTKLLGELNAQNILLAASMAYILGEDFEDIVKAISSLKAPENRLELKTANGFYIIDDSYNTNVSGAEQALKVLASFSGKKIVITPGIVELGAMQYEKNFLLGKQIAQSADVVLVMNEVNKNALVSGIKAGGFDEKNIYFAVNRAEQKAKLVNMVEKGAVVLFLSDLPDNYK